MKSKKTLIILLVITALGGVGYFFGTMKTFADGVIEDSKRIEELKKSGAFDEFIRIAENPANQIISDSTAHETNDPKTWLFNTIKEFFDQNSRQHFRDITTERYAEYKQDALCVVYDCDNSLTEEQFEQKWSNIYDISYAGFGESFLTGQQDWGNIIIFKCLLTSEPKQGVYIFDTIVEDTIFELKYSIEITVMQTDDGFKIDDVKKRK
jgi:hypothetical protein